MKFPGSSAAHWQCPLAALILSALGAAIAPAQSNDAPIGPALLPVADSSVTPVSFEQLPDPTMRNREAAFAAAIDEVRQSGILTSARNVGDRAVDFELKLTNGANLKLSELWAVGPVVLVYYRGNWSAICHQQLRGLQAALQDIHAENAQLIAVSPELPAQQQVLQQQDKITFPLVSDASNTAAKQYGIVYRLPASVIPYYRPFVDMQKGKEGPSYELPLAATYVIDTGGVIRYAFLDADYTHRPEPQKILSVLHRLKRDAGASPASQPLARR